MLNWTTEPGMRIMYDGFYQHPMNGSEPYQGMMSDDIIKLNDGSYRMYLSSFHGWAAEPYNMTRSAISQDLLNWTVEPGVRIDSGEFAGELYKINAIFSKVLQLPGEAVRIFFAGYTATQIPGVTGTLGNFFLQSAVSPDGLNFTVEPGTRTFPQPYPHYCYRAYPSNIIKTSKGLYRMYLMTPYGGGGVSWFNVVSIVSEDGLNWVNEPGSRWKWSGAYVEGDPVYPENRFYAVPLDGDGVRLFIGTINNTAVKRHWMFSAISSDGLNFVQEPGNRMYYSSSPISNPVIVKIPGGHRMIFSLLTNQYPERFGKIYSAVSYD